MKQQEELSLIERYLLATLSEVEHKYVEARIANDNNFAKKVRVFRTALKEIHRKGAERTRKRVMEVEDQLQEEGFFLTDDDIIDFLRNPKKSHLRPAVLQRIKQDAEFAKRVEQMRPVIEQIEGAGKQRLSKKIKNIETELEEEGFFQPTSSKPLNRSRSRSIKRFVAIAAAVLIVVALSIYLLIPTSPEQLYAAHFSRYPDQISQILQETGFVQVPQQDRLLRAMQAYKSEELVEAEKQMAAFLETADDEHPYRRIIRFYWAQINMERGNLEAAREALKALATDSNFSRQNAAEWYLALTYLKTDADQAIQHLKPLMEDPEYGNRARQLLRKLQ